MNTGEIENKLPVKTDKQNEQQPTPLLTDLPAAATQTEQVRSGRVRVGKLLEVNY